MSYFCVSFFVQARAGPEVKLAGYLSLIRQDTVYLDKYPEDWILNWIFDQILRRSDIRSITNIIRKLELKKIPVWTFGIEIKCVFRGGEGKKQKTRIILG